MKPKKQKAMLAARVAAFTKMPDKDELGHTINSYSRMAYTKPGSNKKSH